MNGDAEEKSDRNSPEVNSQEQMAAQRASGGVIQAPEVCYCCIQPGSALYGIFVLIKYALILFNLWHAG